MSAQVWRLETAGNQDPNGPPVHANNVWLIGDDAFVILIDPAHDCAAVAAAVGDRQVAEILLTHGHWDHIRAAVAVGQRFGVIPRLHPADAFLWEAEHGSAPFLPLADGQRFVVAGLTLEARHTPGHTPGSTSLVASDLATVFTGDTLFQGGPGATRWDYSSFDTIITSIRERLLTLPPEFTVNTGHGPSTSIAREAPQLPAWVARGW